MTVRLKKNDRQRLIEALDNRGFRIETTANRVVAHSEKGEYVCGFYWSKLHRCWRFDVPRPYVHTRKGLEIALDEFDRDQLVIAEAEGAFQEWRAKPAMARWLRYMGFLAKFYLRHT